MTDLVEWLTAQLDDDERVALAATQEEYWGPAEDVPRPAAAHIARWDPARVLADVEAKRMLLRLHRADMPRSVATVRVLAQPYRGRPGWRDEWTNPLPLTCGSSHFEV